MNIEMTGENLTINLLNSPVLSADSVIIKTADEKKFSLPFSKSEITYKADETEVKLKIETADAQITVKTKGNLAAISLRASLKENMPSFGYQSSLAENSAVSITFTLSADDDLTAIYQHKEWWLRPSFCKTLGEVPEKTQLLLTQKAGKWLCLLAVCGNNDRGDIKGEGNAITLSLSSNVSGRKAIDDIAAVVALGDDPYKCINDAISFALEKTQKHNKLRCEKSYPEIFEYLGWCSWDALGHSVNEKDIIDKIKELRDKNVPVKWALIDDGWSKVDFDKGLLQGLDADTSKFPGGLKETVSRLKNELDINWVGIWHAISGYWNGVESKSHAFYDTCDDLETVPENKLIPKSSYEKAFGFFNKWHTNLRREGVDFIKVDSQSTLSLFNKGMRSYGEAADAVHTALEASAAVNFDGALINCMGMAPEDIWNRPNTAISRNSDDFMPREPHAIREHTIENAYNSLLHGSFYYEDWDMFWSKHEAAKANAILRALSGGPIYLSEPLGTTDEAVIMPLVKHDGKILRCDGVGLPTLDCLLCDPVGGNKPLKVFNNKGKNYAVGVFNIANDGKTASAQLKLSDIPSINEKEAYIYDRKSETALLLDSESAYNVEVSNDDAELLLLLPKTGDVTILGMTEKYISFAAVDVIENNEKQTIVKVNEKGTFAFISDSDDFEVTLDGESISYTHSGLINKITLPDSDTHIIIINHKQ